MLPASAGNCLDQRFDQPREAAALRRLDHDRRRRAAPHRAGQASVPRRRRGIRPGRSAGSASASAFISGPASNTRSVPVAPISSASAACSCAECAPSSSMSPSTAMRRPPPGTGVASSSVDRRLHRGRIGVVALVDQRERARPAWCSTMAPARGPSRPTWSASAVATVGDVGADADGPRRARPARSATMCRPGAPMRARHVRPPMRGRRSSNDRPAACNSSSRKSARASSPKPMDALDAGRARPACPAASKLVVVAVEQRRAARLEALEDLGLGRGDLVEAARRMPRWAAAISGDDRDMRAHHLHQRPDLARHGSCRSRRRRSRASRGMRASVSGTPQ